MSESQDNRQRSISENHSKAPICAAFVKAMRDVFGSDQVNVIYVKEGDFEAGRKAWIDLDDLGAD